jgi:nucleotide-binding universal stress UspA family protein
VYQHILAATDFSDLGDRALARAAELAVEVGAKLTLVHVMVSEDSANPMYKEHEVRAQVERLAEARARLSEKVSAVQQVELHFEVRVGNPATEILAAVDQHGADLLVISSNGEKGFTRWLLGTTTDRVVRGAIKDVLVVT